jgi:hypothetical protein
MDHTHGLESFLELAWWRWWYTWWQFCIVFPALLEGDSLRFQVQIIGQTENTFISDRLYLLIIWVVFDWRKNSTNSERLSNGKYRKRYWTPRKQTWSGFEFLNQLFPNLNIISVLRLINPQVRTNLISKLETRNRLSNNRNGAYGRGFAIYISFLSMSLERILYITATIARSRILPPPV